jgi:hypothetical protein
VVDEVMVYISNGEAYKQLNRLHLKFLMKPWNIRVGLCIRVILYAIFLLVGNIRDEQKNQKTKKTGKKITEKIKP